MKTISNAAHIVVIGAGYAGMMAAFNAAGRTRGANTRVTLINPTAEFVERIRLHQIAAGERVKRIRIDRLAKGTGIDFVQGRVTRIDPNDRALSVSENGGERSIRYDTLIYALGSSIDIGSVPGVREYAHTLTGTNAAALNARLRELPTGAAVLVCGGGLTGIETASEIAETHPTLKVTLITSGSVGYGLSERGRDYLRAAFGRLGVQVIEGTRIERVTPDAVVSDHGALPYQVVVWAGSFAVPGLARDSGIAVNERGQIITDEHLRSISHPSILAAGDSAYPAAHPYPLRMACATAMPMGAAAGENAARISIGLPVKPFGMAFVVQCISLGQRDGLVQIVQADDHPEERIYTGIVGAVVKEMICQYTRWGLRFERLRPGTYYYPRAKASSTQTQGLRTVKQTHSSE